ncbi:RNA polymerase sigma factor [Pseudonocardia xishanensis]|uniref:Sigma-70 family RNA polymerase sigma factor n=1 Tax=Pseudonocardia xishanensis TaxID=630995 RepID=A0ABP8RCS2_9PSEU
MASEVWEGGSDEEFFAQHVGMKIEDAAVVVGRVARRYFAGDVHMIEDVSQDTLEELWAGPARLPEYEPTAWVYFVARRIAVDLLRSRQRERDRAVREFLLRPRTQPRDMAEAVVARVWSEGMAKILEAAIARLPPDHQRILGLCLDPVKGDFRAMSEKELATELAVPQGTVKSRKNAALRRLRDVLIDLGARPENDHDV